jgi:SNF2 family DNA or RNA helicase
MKVLLTFCWIQVLSLYGIECLVYHGGMTENQRTQVLKTFRLDHKARVLLLSNVGATGINLDEANWMIIVVGENGFSFCMQNTYLAQDTLWSAQDDAQLQGRINRFPQQKHVHFYRLIAKNTSDVFLNNISFRKEAIQQAFLGASPAMRELTKQYFSVYVTHEQKSRGDVPTAITDRKP